MNIPSILSFLEGKKTYSASIASILSMLAAYLSGDVNIIDALQIIVPAVLAMTMRNAIKVGQP